MMNTYAFSLGREWKLSLAELFSVFGKESYQSHTDTIAIFSYKNGDSEMAHLLRNLGGSIRVMRIIRETDEKRFPTDVLEIIRNLKKQDQKESITNGTNEISKDSSKYTFALGVYGCEYPLFEKGMRIKKTLIENGIPARLVNTENMNISSVIWKKEKLGRSQSEYTLIRMKDRFFLGVTLACQDIDAYTKRDIERIRDMHVGMMPPKLCQIMIHLANEGEKKSIYDPFCGLGTILIEALNMGIHHIIGSDISETMIDASQKNIQQFIENEKIWQERIRMAGGTPRKDFSLVKADIFRLDARTISIHERNRILHSNIVSEGYLGTIMFRESIDLTKVRKERDTLGDLYTAFFSRLNNIEYSGNIVMSFPFWNIHGSISFFSEIYDIIRDNNFEILPLLPENILGPILTPKGSLLYRRPGQNVGREIIKMRRKSSTYGKNPSQKS